MHVASLQVTGEGAWPRVRVSAEALEERVGRWLAVAHAATDPNPDLAEIYLALACWIDAPRALASLEAHYFASALPALRSFSLEADELAEVVQRTRVRLLVAKAHDGVPALVRYAGKGRLGGLVRVTLLREARRFKLRRGRDPGAPMQEPSSLPETEFARAELEAFLKPATAAAVARLDARSRTLLRLHYVRGIRGSDIARMYGVHRGTVSRWLAAARLELVDAVHDDLRERVPNISRDARADLRELVDSRLDLSLSRVLGETHSGTSRCRRRA